MDNGLAINHEVDAAEKDALAAGTDKLNKALFEMADAYARDPEKFERAAREVMHTGVEVPIEDGSGDSLYLRAMFGVFDGIKRTDDAKGLDADAFKKQVLKPALEKAIHRFYGNADFDAVQLKLNPQDGKGSAEMKTPIGQVKVYRDTNEDSPLELALDIEKNVEAIVKDKSDKSAMKALHKNAERLATNYDPVFNEQVNLELNYLHAVRNLPEVHLLGGSTDAIFSYIRDEQGNKVSQIMAMANKPTKVVKVDESS